MKLPDFDRARNHFRTLKKRHERFYQHIASEHLINKDTNRGHDLEHDAQVALNSLAFAPDEHVGELAWIASFCHSTDYWMPRGKRDGVRWESFVREALDTISGDTLTQDEREIVVQAVLRHHLKNQEDDSIVQQVLQDADRIGILFVSTAFRIGRGYPDLPLVDPRDLPALDPDSDYHNPWSCLNDFENCWEQFPPQFRTVGAKALAEQVLLPALEAFFAAIREQHGTYGILASDL